MIISVCVWRVSRSRRLLGRLMHACLTASLHRLAPPPSAGALAAPAAAAQRLLPALPRLPPLPQQGEQEGFLCISSRLCCCCTELACQQQLLPPPVHLSAASGLDSTHGAAVRRRLCALPAPPRPGTLGLHSAGHPAGARSPPRPGLARPADRQPPVLTGAGICCCCGGSSDTVVRNASARRGVASIAPQRFFTCPLPCRLQVSKKLLLLYVQEQPGGTDCSTPNCLATVAVHERLVRRWVPESHRPPP